MNIRDSTVTEPDSDVDAEGIIPISPPETELDTLELALQHGDASLVHTDLLESAIEEELENIEATQDSILKAIYKLDDEMSPTSETPSNIDLDPSIHSMYLESNPHLGTFPILISNASGAAHLNSQNKALAIVGERSNQARFMIFGSNILNDIDGEIEYNDIQGVITNGIAWVANSPSFKDNDSNIVLSHIVDDQDANTHEWVRKNYPNAYLNEINTCETSNLNRCLNGADLLILGHDSTSFNEAYSVDVVLSAVDKALKNGISVLYVHSEYFESEMSNAIFKYFNVKATKNRWNHVAREKLSGASVSDVIYRNHSFLDLKKSLIATMKNDFRLDINKDNCTSSYCANEQVMDRNTGITLEDILSGFGHLRSDLSTFDSENRDLFKNKEHIFLQLVILLGDKYRKEVEYPMDKFTSDSGDLIRSLFSDSTVYNSRTVNPTQRDLGNFSRSDFDHITPTNGTINITSRRHFRSTGFYALPGQTFQVTRTDTSQTKVGIFINTQRPSSTKIFAKNGYKRPKYLRSNTYNLPSGETIELTTPYGGPIQVSFDENDYQVVLNFNGVGEHPHWSDASDNHQFTQSINENNYDWVEISTPGFEVHSTREKMLKSLDRWGTASAIAEATMEYTYNLPHVLAGFQGEGIDILEEIVDFARQKGWDMDSLNYVKHMNADQATCGFGCSGNPYDANWAFNPIGHGDIHELGHGLQGAKRFAGWQNHTMTNFYAYYTQRHYNARNGVSAACPELEFEKLFSVLQSSVHAEDPKAYVKENLWDVDRWKEGAGMFMQMMMSAQHSGALQDGYTLRARLHIFEREMQRAIMSNDNWLKKRDSLGMGNYSLAEAKSLSNNDFYLIGTSVSTERDYRDYYTMWALEFSDKADEQVNSYGYPEIERVFFVNYSETDQCGLGGPFLPVDGNRVWPREDTEEDMVVQ